MAVTLNGITRYAVSELNETAVRIARQHAKANGGGRPFGISWELVIGSTTSLAVEYHCNRPNGHCGIYRTGEVL